MFLRLLRKNALIGLICGLAIEAWIALPGEVLIATAAAQWLSRGASELWSWLEVGAAAVAGMLINDLALYSLSRVARGVALQFIHLPHPHFHLSGLDLMVAKFIPPLRSAAFVLYGFQGGHLEHLLYVSLISSVFWVGGYALLGKKFRGRILRLLARLESRNRWTTAAEIALTLASLALIAYPL